MSEKLVGKNVKQTVLGNVITIDTNDNGVQLNSVGYLLLNRITTAQRDALTAVSGMLIYNTTTSKLNVYTGAAWESVTSA